MKEAFIEHRFKRKSVALIQRANTIIGEMQAAGYTLTIRQLYYQFVARGFLPNTQKNYKMLASLMDDARKAGHVDWDAIEDRTRYLRRIASYANPPRFLDRQARSYYAEDLWRDQDYYAEVWVEKDALLGVVERPCNENRVPYLACRGYPSSSELYLAGKRFERKMDAGKRCVLFYLGDHDPSGIDMTRNANELVGLFARSNGVEIRRLALNMDQVEEYAPPPNPAKETDSRFWEYQGKYGDESWELDALDPAVLDQAIRDGIASVIDQERFDANHAAEEANKNRILEVAEHWDEIKDYLKYRITGHDEVQYGLYPSTLVQEIKDAYGEDEDQEEIDADAEDEPEEDEDGNT